MKSSSRVHFSHNTDNSDYIIEGNLIWRQPEL